MKVVTIVSNVEHRTPPANYLYFVKCACSLFIKERNQQKCVCVCLHDNKKRISTKRRNEKITHKNRPVNRDEQTVTIDKGEKKMETVAR